MAMTIKQLRAASDDDLIEAHDEVASYHRPRPPKVNLGAGGDYGYDEAHDFGAS